MAAPTLRANPRGGRSGGNRERALPDRGNKSGGLLPFPATRKNQAHGYGSTQPDATHCAAVAGLRVSSGACRTPAPGLDHKSQARLAPAASGQSTVRAAPKVLTRDHRLQTRIADL